MNVKYSLNIRIEVEAADETEALLLLNDELGRRSLSKEDITLEGYVHPDGKLRPSPLPPEGYRLELFPMSNLPYLYQVSLALPSKAPTPEELTTPALTMCRNGWKQLSKAPAGSLIWDEQQTSQERRWRLITEVFETLDTWKDVKQC